jgi:hypothetical protein
VAGHDAERLKDQIRAIKEKIGPIAAELHAVEQARRQHVAHRLSAIFRAYQCRFLDWDALLDRFSKADPSWDASSAVSTDIARMMGPPKPGAREACLVRLLELPKHLRVEPLRPAAAPPRNAARDRMIVYLMIAELTGAPDTGRSSSPSALQAARHVQTRIAEMGPDAPTSGHETGRTPSVHTIRKVWTEAFTRQGSNGFDGAMFEPPQRMSIGEQQYHYNNSIYRQLRRICFDLELCVLS